MKNNFKYLIISSLTITYDISIEYPLKNYNIILTNSCNTTYNNQ